MADQDIAIPQMDDRELFNAAMEPEPKVEAQREPEPQQQERPRDDQGRFVSQEAKPEPVQAEQSAQQQPAQADDKDGQVPSWRLREIREARDAAEQRAQEAQRQAYAIQHQMTEMRRQMEALQKPKAEPVDFFANPDQAIEQRLTPIEERFAALESQVRLNSSRAMAVVMHGKETVAEMEKAVAQAIQQGHPDMQALSMQMQRSDDPVGLAVQWHQRQKMMSETGGDLAAYKAKLLDEAMKDPAFQAKVLEATRGAAQQNAQNGGRPNIQLPPSINKATGAGVSPAVAAAEGDMSDRALFRHAMDSPRSGSRR